jgi:hypothetical protein
MAAKTNSSLRARRVAKSPEKLAIRKYFLLCCEQVSSVSNPGALAIKDFLMGALRGAKHAIFDRLAMESAFCFQ